jgi:adenosylcobinamide-GDP ribazoletransferase
LSHRLAVHELRMFLIALQFLTRVPVPAWVGTGFEPVWLNRCVVHFPLVGALVGTAGAAVLWLAGLCWTPLVAALLAVATTVWLTGAFHEDGLADTFDALGGSVPRERALEIMKDSRIGTYGTAALGLGLALRVSLLAAAASADLAAAVLALVAAHVLGRAAAVGVMAWLPYGGDAAHAKARPLATAVPRSTATAALLVAATLVAATAALAALVAPAIPASTVGWAWRWSAATLAAVGVVLLMRRWLQARLGGYTGDTLGATEQLTEVAVLMALSGG